MKLSEIDFSKSQYYHYDVEVDQVQLPSCDNLEEIGLLVETNDCDDFADAFIDTLTLFQFKNVNVIAEVPCGCLLSPRVVCYTATNLNASVSLVLPDTPSDLDLDIYLDNLKRYVFEWFWLPNFSSNLFPISDCFKAMIKSVISNQDTPFINTGYMQRRFIDRIDPVVMKLIYEITESSIKEEVAKYVEQETGEQVHDVEVAFKHFVYSTISGVYQCTQKLFKQKTSNQQANLG